MHAAELTSPTSTTISDSSPCRLPLGSSPSAAGRSMTCSPRASSHRSTSAAHVESRSENSTDTSSSVSNNATVVDDADRVPAAIGERVKKRIGAMLVEWLDQRLTSSLYRRRDSLTRRQPACSMS